MDDNRQTKRCKECGRELPLDYFIKIYGRNYSNICKECHSKKVQETKFNNKVDSGEITEDDFVVVYRKLKKISSTRILKKGESGIDHIARDEKFVKLMDYKDSWISNYGRLIVKNDMGTYQLIKGNRIRSTGELTYTLQKNICFKTKKEWGYKKDTVLACDLVIQTFIVNYDIKNNTVCWHKDNNVKDNYYKNLYPVTEKQYQVIKEKYEKTDYISEDEIMEIVNATEYKHDNWKPWYYARTYMGVGYTGGNVDVKSDVWIRWINMIQRCYSKTVHKLKPYYKGKKVCEEWQNFQNFKAWYDEHFVAWEKVDLDKDLLIQGNNVYSPETCAFITHFLNTIFEDRGVKQLITQNKDKKYNVAMLILNKKQDVGVFDTKEEAVEALADYKKQYIVSVAESCKGKVQDCVYQAMLKWKVDIAA